MGHLFQKKINMNQEKYNLNWHTYSDHLQDLLHNMRKMEYLTDVTLVCDDQKQFKAHKIVLSACSTVFKNIIDSLPLNSSVIYLRGIHHQEMESILEFMYLGVATFYQERMNEFLNVAKNLEIKEISKDVDFNNDEEFNEDVIEPTHHQNNDQVKANETDEQISNQFIKRNSKTDADTAKSIVKNTNGKFECDQCNKQIGSKQMLKIHIQSQHEGVRYPCNQCEYQATQQTHLVFHIQSKHEGIRYPCNQCDFKAIAQRFLINHIKSKHEGIRYPCNKCDYQATTQTNLINHIKSKHEGVKYPCNQCDYQATQQSSLIIHIKSKHEGVKYPCNQCDYQATNQSGLVIHIKSKHEGVKYPCEQCDYKATTHSSLIRHIKSKHEA